MVKREIAHYHPGTLVTGEPVSGPSGGSSSRSRSGSRSGKRDSVGGKDDEGAAALLPSVDEMSVAGAGGAGGLTAAGGDGDQNQAAGGNRQARDDGAPKRTVSSSDVHLQRRKSQQGSQQGRR